MKFDAFVRSVNSLPVIESENLRHKFSSPNALEVQMTRWAGQGKLVKLKRGVYLLAEPYRKILSNEFFLASVLKRPSYVSLEKALEYHDLIPEAVSVYTSVTTKRQGRFDSDSGIFDYQHIQVPLFWGYEAVKLRGQMGFVALPEKALLDFIYLKHPRLSPDYLESLRLQNLGKINARRLETFARRFKKPKMLEAARLIRHFIRLQSKEKML